MGPDAPFVRIRLQLGQDGIIRQADAVGHAGTEAGGFNVACAAVSVLLRSAYETFAQFKGVDISGQAGAPGNLSFTVRHFLPELEQKMRGASDFLLVGLSGVEREYPGKIQLDISIFGGNYGS